MAGHDVGGLLDQRLEAVERGEVGVARAARRQHRDLDRRQVVAAHEHLRPRDPHRRAVRGVAVGRRAARAPGHRARSAPGRAAPAAPAAPAARALHVVLLVELAHRALRAAGLVVHPLRGRLADAQRRVGERVAAEHVVPVGVGDHQPDDAEARLVGDRGQDLELVGQHRRVDAERLLAGAHERAGRLPEARRDDHDVGVKPDGAHSDQAAPSSLAASRRVFTSAVGFFCEESSCSLLRLTQTTGTLALMHGSTS